MREPLQCQIIVYKIIQLILGLLFVVSGFVKGVDPFGVSYKVMEYLKSFGFELFTDCSLVFAVLLCAVEIFIGLMLLSGIYRKMSSLLALLFLSGFTLITFYLVVNPSSDIQECGCFGDAFHLTNIETFIKNILFVTLSILYTRRQFQIKVPSSSNKKRVISFRISTFGCVVMLSLFIPLYSFIYLPPFDFLPFNIGVNILENQNLNHTDESGEVRLIYKNKQSGESRKFSMDDSTWRDTTMWEYIDTEVPETKRENYMSKFVVMDGVGNDFSSLVFDDSDYNFIIIARNIEDLRTDDFKRIAPLYQLYKDEVINLYLFTSSDIEETRSRLSSQNLENISIYNVDEVVLKSMIRNPRGVMLVSDGVISGKWNLKRDSFEGMTKEKLPALLSGERYTLIEYIVILLSFGAVLLCLGISGAKMSKKEI